MPEERRVAIVREAEVLRERMLAMPPVPFYRSLALTTLPYPMRYGLRDASALPWPYLMLTNRVFVVQFHPFGLDMAVDRTRVQTLLVSPTDTVAARQTPHFKRIAEAMGPLQSIVEPLVARQTHTVETALHACGLGPADIDWLTYDHLHTQDLRRWLGSAAAPALFPTARVLVMDAEWQACHGLCAPQRDWYAPAGIDGVPAARVERLDGSVLLGEGVALVATPGHTMGNHSIAVRTPEGVFVTSENGISADSYAPRRSRLPGLPAYAGATGMDIVLNGNTLEGALDQYLSMHLERALAGPSQRADGLPNVVPSSELTPTWWAPGLTPTLWWGELAFGQVQRPPHLGTVAPAA
ncbi:MAG: hypothetical protein EXR79_15545 [Myxococcales bacterium]|nr:hypothetical protein [Myxococcales bacterium]